MIIVADSSPLIALAILNKLDLLISLFDEIVIPFSVFEEVDQTDKKFNSIFQSWSLPKVRHCKNLEAFSAYKLLLSIYRKI